MTPSTRVLVASSAMLAFISFWRVAAIVLNDMGSSAFYAGAISEHFVGKFGLSQNLLCCDQEQGWRSHTTFRRRIDFS